MLNTLYLGDASGWTRVGATIPANRPDGLGWGKSQNEQADFAFSSDTPLVLWDQKNHTPYLIGWFGSRDISGRQYQEGYHIYTWSPRKNTLQELDKWEPGSVATQVYEYFKQHGAVDTTKEKSSVDFVVKFDPEIEKNEFDLGCLDDVIKTKSRYFSHLCETKSAG